MAQKRFEDITENDLLELKTAPLTEAQKKLMREAFPELKCCADCSCTQSMQPCEACPNRRAK